MSDTPKGQMMSQIENWPGECLHGLGARARNSLRCLLTAMPLDYLMATYFGYILWRQEIIYNLRE